MINTHLQLLNTKKNLLGRQEICMKFHIFSSFSEFAEVNIAKISQDSAIPTL